MSKLHWIYLLTALLLLVLFLFIWRDNLDSLTSLALAIGTWFALVVLPMLILMADNWYWRRVVGKWSERLKAKHDIDRIEWEIYAEGYKVTVHKNGRTSVGKARTFEDAVGEAVSVLNG